MKIPFGLALLLPLLTLAAQDSVLTFSAGPAPAKKAASGDTLSLQFTAILRKPWHIYANKIKDEFLIPSRLEIKGEGIEVVNIDYPKGVERTFMGITEFLYEGRVDFPVKLLVAGQTKKVEVSFHYQACNDRLCLAPAVKTVVLELP